MTYKEKTASLIQQFVKVKASGAKRRYLLADPVSLLRKLEKIGM